MTVVEGVRRFAAPPERVFALLTDPDVIARAIPSVRGHSVVDADHCVRSGGSRGCSRAFEGPGLGAGATRQANRTLDAVERAF